jgi:hypothetical protein
MTAATYQELESRLISWGLENNNLRARPLSWSGSMSSFRKIHPSNSVKTYIERMLILRNPFNHSEPEQPLGEDKPV